MRSMSAKRRRQLAERTRVREQVIARDQTCVARTVITEIACGFLPERPGLEVDEIRGGSYRCTEWLQPERCRLLCPAHHDFATDNKREFNRRMGVV